MSSTPKVEAAIEAPEPQNIPGNNQQKRRGFRKRVWYCITHPGYAWKRFCDRAKHPVKGRLLFLGAIACVWLGGALPMLWQARHDRIGLIISLAAVITAAVALWQICMVWRVQRVVTISREELAKATTWIRLLVGSAVAVISATWVSKDLGAVLKAIPGTESVATFIIIGALGYALGTNYADYCKILDRAEVTPLPLSILEAGLTNFNKIKCRLKEKIEQRNHRPSPNREVAAEAPEHQNIPGNT